MENKELKDLQPLGFRVLLTIYKRSSTTSSGLILPESENDGLPVIAQITKVGKKTFIEKLQVFLGIKRTFQVGQWISFRKYSVDELRFITSDGEKQLYILEEDEIIGLAEMA